MPNIKVMLVDDEILAIEYIRDLVDWESLGFEIVATQTQPLKVIDSIRQTRPDLMIMDIVMPGMDGLELSCKIIQEFPNLNIILLTSYKDFEYAKTAIKLGIYNYLVKHELNAEHLQEELLRLKQDLQLERKKLLDELEALLLHWFSGAQLHQISPLQKLLSWQKQWQMILLKESIPFSWLDSDHHDAQQKWNELNFEQMLEHKQRSTSQQLLLTISIQKRYILLLYGLTDVASVKKQKELLETELLAVKEALKETSTSSFASALVSQITKIEDIPFMLKTAFDKLESSFFYGPEEIFRLELSYEEQPLLEQLTYEEELDMIKQNIQDSSFTEAAKGLESILERIRYANDLSALKESCLTLYMTLNRQAISTLGSSLPLLWEQGEISEPYFNSFDELKRWFASVVTCFIALTKAQKGLSRKVRTALEYIESRYADSDFHIEQLAEQLNISSDHLRHLFKEELGITIHDKLTEIRLQHAKRLLREGKLKVYQIAERVGYRESKYFSQVFRKHMGMTPQEYMDRSR